MKGKLCIAPSLLLFLLAGNVNAQTPAWEADLGSQVLWQRTNQFGSLIAATPDGIKGINPTSGKVEWSTRKELGLSPESSFTLIDNTPFFTVTAGNPENEDFCVVESFEGKILFSSKEAGLQKVTSQYFLHQSQAILVLGTQAGSKSPTVHMIDMTTGQKLWSKPSDFGLVTACKDLGNGECVVTTAFFTYKLNVKTGDAIWKKSIDPKYEKMGSFMSMLDKGTAAWDGKQITAAVITTEKKPGVVFIALQASNKKETKDSQGKVTVTETFERNYMAYDISNGNNAWTAVVNLQGTMGVIIPDENGLIVGSGNSNDVNCIDYATGTTKWGKKGRGIDVKGGPAQGSAYVDGKLILVSGKENNYIDMINPSTGESLFPKSVKIDGKIEFLQPLKTGLLFASNEEVNIINTTTGEKILEKSLRSTSRLMTQQGEITYVFNKKDKKIYKLDNATGTLSAINTVPVEFKGKEDATSIEANDEGFLIMSDQNIAMVDKAGAVKFNKYYEAPQEPGLKRALLYANAVYAGYASLSYGMASAAFGATSQSIQVKNNNDKLAKDVTGAVSQVYGDASKSAMGYAGKMLQQANKRFKATQQTPEYVFMLTETGKRQYALIRVSKKSGDILSTIDLGKDKTPVYEIDGVENRVFYKYKDNSLKGFQF